MNNDKAGSLSHWQANENQTTEYFSYLKSLLLYTFLPYETYFQCSKNRQIYSVQYINVYFKTSQYYKRCGQDLYMARLLLNLFFSQYYRVQ